MKPCLSYFRFIVPVIAICLASSWVTQPALTDPVLSAVRVTGYYTRYQRIKLAPSEIDYSALSYIAHFAVMPNEDGSINVGRLRITTDNSEDLIARAHAAGRAVLLCVGGADSAKEFRPAITDPVSRERLADNLVKALTPAGYSDGTNKVANYDGIDMDMEPMRADDKDNYQAFIKLLRSKMNAYDARKLLTLAGPQGTTQGGGYYPQIFDGIQDLFDQINVMTYTQSAPWSKGWTTWHSGEIWDTNTQIPNSSTYYPSAQRSLRMYLDYRNSAGQPVYTTASGKMAIGIGFVAQEWTGVHDIKQPVRLDQDGKVATIRKQMTYDKAMSLYEGGEYIFHRDASTSFGATHGGFPTEDGAAYLNYQDASNSANDRFISFDDPVLIKAKIDFARKNNLGVIIWNLGDGYRPNSAVKDPLLQAVKVAAQPVATYPLPNR